jgi:predicted GNAT family N-acyltransferase
MAQELTPRSAPDLSPYRFEPLGSHHRREDFVCSKHELTNYFASDGITRDSEAFFTRAFVWVESSTDEVVGFFTLSTSSLRRELVPGDPAGLPYGIVPVILLGRMALHRRLEGQGLGRYLLFAALEHAYQASLYAAAYAVIVDAKDDELVSWYAQFGFELLQDRKSTRRMFLPMRKLVPPPDTQIDFTDTYWDDVEAS